jgi:hypothetical protein
MHPTKIKNVTGDLKWGWKLPCLYDKEYLQQPVKQNLKRAWERQRQRENEGKVVQQLQATLTSVPRGLMTTWPPWAAITRTGASTFSAMRRHFSERFSERANGPRSVNCSWCSPAAVVVVQCVPLAGSPGKMLVYKKKTKVQYICMSYLLMKCGCVFWEFAKRKLATRKDKFFFH